MTQIGVAAVFTPDQINRHYATGTRKLTIWSLLGASRLLLHFARGPTCLYEFRLGEHLSAHQPTRRACPPFPVFTSHRDHTMQAGDRV